VSPFQFDNPLGVPQAQAQQVEPNMSVQQAPQPPRSGKYLTQQEYNQKVQDGLSTGLTKDQVNQMILGAGYTVGGIKSFTPDQYSQKVQEGKAAGFTEDQARQMMQAAGYALPPPLPPPAPPSMLSQALSGANDMINAPGDLLAGLGEHGINAAFGSNAFQGDQAYNNLAKNAGNTAKDVIMAGGAALTGGMSLLPQMAAGAGTMGLAETANQGIDAAGGVNPEMTWGDRAKSVGMNAAMGGLAPLAGPRS